MTYKEYRKKQDDSFTLSEAKSIIRKTHRSDRSLSQYTYNKYKAKGGKLTYRQIVQSDPNFKQSYRQN